MPAGGTGSVRDRAVVVKCVDMIADYHANDSHPDREGYPAAGDGACLRQEDAMTLLTRFLLGMVLVGMPFVPIGASQASAQQDDRDRDVQVVTGTLTKLDLAIGKGLVTTDLGKPIFFQVTKPHLFENLSVGTRVTVEIDAEGRANKAIDASVAEFLPVPPEDVGGTFVQPVSTISMAR